MNSTAGRIRQIEDELAGLPAGYISKKMIHGKERFYLQWMENGKLKSRYIKAAEFDAVSAQVERRKQLQEERKKLDSQIRSRSDLLKNLEASQKVDRILELYYGN